MSNYVNWFNKNKDWIHIIASIATILALFAAFWIYFMQSDDYKKNIFEEHTSNIRSLQTEITQNLNLINNFLDKKDEFIGKEIFGKLITENMKRSVIDGKIRNYCLKKYLIKSLFEAEELNAVIFYASISTGEAQRNIQNQIINNIEKKYRPTFLIAQQIIGDYLSCLKEKLNIEKCECIAFSVPLSDC